MYNPPMFIDGQETIPDRDHRVYHSPATGEPITEIILGTDVDVNQAVAAALRANRAMVELAPDDRVERCLRTAAAIEARCGELSEILSREHGKPLHSEARGEVLGAADAFRQAAGQARWSSVLHFELSAPEKRLLSRRRPRGVYGVITPWNFPIGLACMYYLAPGLAAGNTIVWLGAPSTTAVQAEIARTIVDLWPAGAINMLSGDGAQVGQRLVSHPDVAAVGFTGSTATGYAVAVAAAGKPCMLELGGNGPSIVLEDADIEGAAQRIARGTFSNAGQICTATGRVLVDRRVAGELGEALVAEAASVILGDPTEERTTMGPVHQQSVADRVIDQVSAAVSDGARILTGGSAMQGMPTDHYVLPTVVTDVNGASALHRDETFGPVAPLVPFATMAELWQLIESSPYGLHAAIFSRDIERAIGMAEQMRFGHVNLNDTSAYWEPAIPAGGAAGSVSGIGRNGGPWSVLEMTEVFTMTLESRSGSAFSNRGA